MNSISRLNCRIRVVGQPQAAHHLGTRLEAELQHRLAEAYGAALDQILEGDPSVYLMRGLNLRMDIAMINQDTSQVVQQVARKMANTVRRQSLLGEETVRFENQSDYQAHFIRDLLKGVAWDSWLYGPFRKYRALPLKEILRKVLLDEPEILAETLVQLRVIGQLENLLTALSHAALIEVWDQISGSKYQSDELLPEMWRPFYAAAMNLLDQLGMKRSEPPSLESILQGARGGLLNEIDWRDRQSLASALITFLRLLASQGYVRKPSPESGQLLSINEALKSLDWLDEAYLKKELLTWFAELKHDPSTLPLQARPSMNTPRQAKSLTDLLSALQSQDIDLNRLQPDSAENALRLLTLLGETAPYWQNDPLPPRMIALLLAAWESLAHAYEPAQTLAALKQGNLEGALRSLPHTHQSQAQTQFKELLTWGERAVTVLAVISKAGSVSSQSFTLIKTRSAGVALLLRAVIDAHLLSLLAKNDFPNPALSAEQKLQAVLLHCFESWSGLDLGDHLSAEILSTDEGSMKGLSKYDPGLLILAGADLQGEAITPLPTFSLSDLSDFGQIWEEHLAGLRLVSTGNLADDLLRLWARWLRGFADSGIPFLLENFIRRPGALYVGPTEIKVEIEPRALDIVLEMAGYLAPIENISWLGGRRLTVTLASD